MEPKYLILAAHYDSKWEPTGFIGATDSAIPCGILLRLACALDQLVVPWETSSNYNTGFLSETTTTDITHLQIIFFDGEEAFQHWSSSDSIYGARHLAEYWSSTSIPTPSSRHLLTGQHKSSTTKLQQIRLFVLLDLLASGRPRPMFHDYFRSTSKWYRQLRSMEDVLVRQRRLSRDRLKTKQQPYFVLPKEDSYDFKAVEGSGIEDDHIPFVRRGVPVLHLIPYPFPEVWHTMEDDKSAVDYSIADDLERILLLFLTDLLNL